MARLSEYAEAKEVLNAANKHFQQLEKAIWIHAAKLEEANEAKHNCGPLIEKGLRKIAKKRKGLDREEVVHLVTLVDRRGQTVRSRQVPGNHRSRGQEHLQDG